MIDKAICRHIDALASSPRGFVSQAVLAQLRNFVEHIMLKIYANGNDIDNKYENIQKAIDYVKSRGDLKILRKFHDYLQIVASHYTLDEDNSERLMLKYYEYLVRIKKLMHDKYSICVLNNLGNFPINTDSTMQEYYEKIAQKVDQYSIQNVGKSEKYYIQKIKPFFVNQNVYYEVTFTPANDYASKFNRIIAFTCLEIMDNYAVKIFVVRDRVEILGKTMPISIIVGWEVAIRDCEYKNFTSLIRGNAIVTGHAEQQGISRYLTSSGFCLSDLLDLSDEAFQAVARETTHQVKSIVFFTDLAQCRSIVKARKPGSNLIRYLLFHMNNRIIKNQRNEIENENLSKLFVKNGCIPFDKMPFNFSPIKHNPKLKDLFECIDPSDRQHEILARLVRNNTEIKGKLFTPIREITGFSEIEKLVDSYNSTLWYGHRKESRLVIDAGHIFINEYKNDTCFIIKKLMDLSQNGV